ncbi:hypothetical protein PHET_01928 [Paragonimus heterotremus]|uniref:Uncharacterized protein n=1 Tax=Paragonimus heterotremus TaxID=100268 RepID=A0A8J4WU27_9TREM|nr:hypothetical protein PHET_01928 [Paragonimus heterotremus]
MSRRLSLDESGIQIEQTAYEVGAQRNVAFSFTKGSNITAQLTLNGQSRTVQIDEQQKRIVSETISVMQPMQMTYLLTLGNSLGSFNQSGTIEFMERIMGVSIVRAAFPTGSNQQLSFAFISGSSILADLLIDGEMKQTTVNFTSKQIISELFDVTFASELNYILNVSNALGSLELSGAVTFDEPLEGLNVTVTPTEISKGDLVVFRVALARGTSIVLNINYGDKTSYVNSTARFQSLPSAYENTHIYSQSGFFMAQVTVSNSLQQQSVLQQITVKSIGGLYQIFPATGSVPLNEPAVFQVRPVNVSSTMTDMLITLDWGDQTMPYEDQYYAEDNYTHVYQREGSYVLFVEVVDGQDIVQTTAQLNVQEAVSRFVCRLDFNPVRLGDTQTVSFAMKTGKEVMVSVEFVPDASPQSIFLPTSKSGSFVYTYGTAGLYPILLTASNQVRDETCELMADVRNPVVDFTVTFQPLVENDLGDTQLTIDYYGAEANFATNLSYFVNWGDGTDVVSSSLDFTEVPLTLTHRFARLDYFEASVLLDNQVSQMAKSSQIGVFAPFTAVNLRIIDMNIPTVPNQTKFVAGVPVQLSVSAVNRLDNVAETTFTIVYLSTGQSVYLNRTMSSNRTFIFTETGLVELTVTGGNPFSEATTTRLIEVSKRLQSVQHQLSAPGFLRPGEPGTLHLQFETTNAAMCICLQKDDFAGSLIYPPLGQTQQDCPACAQFRVMFERPVNNSLSVELYYASVGVYEVTVQTWDASQNFSHTILITVTDTYCEPPHIVLVYEIATSPNYPISIRSDQPVVLETSIHGTNCTAVGINYIEWTLTKLDPITVENIEEIHVQDPVIWTMRDLRIEENTLFPGFYEAKMQLTVQTGNLVPTITTDITAYVRVEFPPIVVRFFPGSPEVIDIGLLSSDVCLRPNESSYDPAVFDRQANQNFSDWIWHCAQAGENFTDTLTSPKPSGFTFTGSRTGCFGDGPGRIDTQAGALCFWTGNLEPDRVYLMRIKVSKLPNRHGEAFLKLQTKNALLPVVNLTALRSVGAVISGVPEICIIECNGSVFDLSCFGDSLLCSCSVLDLCRKPPVATPLRASWAISQTDNLYLSAAVTTDSVVSSIDASWSWELNYVYTDTEGEAMNDTMKQLYLRGK